MSSERQERTDDLEQALTRVNDALTTVKELNWDGLSLDQLRQFEVGCRALLQQFDIAGVYIAPRL